MNGKEWAMGKFPICAFWGRESSKRAGKRGPVQSLREEKT